MRDYLRPRNLIWLGIALAALAALAYALRQPPIPVDLATIGRGDIVVTVGDEGEARVRDVYVVSAPIAGRMLRIDSEPGDSVVQNQTVLARFRPIDPTFLDVRARRQAEAEVETGQAALNLARAERERAQAELEFAENELVRAQALSQRGNISLRALDRAVTETQTRRAALETAKAALEVRRHELETARAALIGPNGPAENANGCCIDLVAPVSGQVLLILQKSEAVVAAGTPLIEIGDPQELEVVVDLLSTDAVSVHEGAEVMIEGWGGDAILAGRVRRIEPFAFTKVSALGIEEQRVNVIVDFADTAPRPLRLGHGYRVEARIVVEARRDVLRVPLGALFRSGDDWTVFVDNEDTAKLRRVDIGRNDGRMAELRNGLAAGERVVLHPGDRVADGARIVPRR